MSLTENEVRYQNAALVDENERLREAARAGLSWLFDLEHMGSIVDQEALSGDIAKITAALGWVRAANQQKANTSK